MNIDERTALIKWHSALDFYGHDWDETFDNRSMYYTQEFWYLLVDCVIFYWQGQPLTVGNACERMKAGSKRTREERIKRAELDGFLEKEKLDTDRRETFLIPTSKLQNKIYAHLKRTLLKTLETLEGVDVKDDAS